MDGVETPLLTVEQDVYLDAPPPPRLLRTRQPHALTVDAGKISEGLHVTPTADMVDAARHMVTAARRPIIAVPDAKVVAPLVVEEEPQRTQSLALLRQSRSSVRLPPLLKLAEEQSLPTDHAVLPMATPFVVTGLKDRAARPMVSAVQHQLTAAKDVKADPALVPQWFLLQAHHQHRPIQTLALLRSSAVRLVFPLCTLA